MRGGHRLPRLAPLRPLTLSLSKGEHAHPIILSLSKDETRATEYSKAATRGNWGEVWDNFDRRKAAKAANDTPAEGEGGDDMFSRAGVAAE